MKLSVDDFVTDFSKKFPDPDDKRDEVQQYMVIVETGVETLMSGFEDLTC